MCEVAAAEMAKTGMVDGETPSAWFTIYQQNLKLLALLALRLRIGPQCRSVFSRQMTQLSGTDILWSYTMIQLWPKR